MNGWMTWLSLSCPQGQEWFPNADILNSEQDGTAFCTGQQSTGHTQVHAHKHWRASAPLPPSIPVGKEGCSV